MTLRQTLLSQLKDRWGEKVRGNGHPTAMERRLFPPPPPPVEIVDYSTALRSIRDRLFCQSEKYREQQWRADSDGARPDILEFRRVFIKRLRKLDVPMFAHEIWRTDAQQNANYVRGVSNAKAGESAHNWGAAVDIIHGTKGWDLDKKSWEILGHIGKEVAFGLGIKITWGGDWKFWDPAHWELCDWREVKHKRQ